MLVDDKLVENKEMNVYLQKYYRTQFAIVFILSNSVVQMNYADHVELIYRAEDHMFFLKDAKILEEKNLNHIQMNIN